MQPRCTIINKPLSPCIYQRNNENKAIIPIEIIYTRPVVAIKVKATGKDVETPWINLELYYGRGTVKIELPCTGWYKVRMKAFDEDENVVEEDFVENIGVGEIFITGGQSNSLNFGEVLTESDDNRVLSWNTQINQWIKCKDPQPCEIGPEVDMGNGGSIWPTLGLALAKELDMPIGFLATGWGGAGIKEFGEGTIKYERIINALNTIKENGARAVLWHQGETDAVNKTTREEYEVLLKSLIYRSRRDTGLNIPWVIANASYHPKAENIDKKAILEAQRNCCNDKDVLLGPNTDNILGDNRINNSAHFNLKGLKAHGISWFEILVKYFFANRE